MKVNWYLIIVLEMSFENLISGSTCVAALNTNRQYIGIEMDDKYFDIAQNRIRDFKECLKQA